MGLSGAGRSEVMKAFKSLCNDKCTNKFDIYFWWKYLLLVLVTMVTTGHGI